MVSTFFPHLADKDGNPTGLRPGDSLTAFIRGGHCELIPTRGNSDRMFFLRTENRQDDKMILPFRSLGDVFNLMLVISCLLGMRFEVETDNKTLVRYRFVGIAA